MSTLSSPHRRTQNAFSQSSSFSSRKHREEFSWPALFERHRFLLTMLALLLFLCIVYLYFAVTLGATDSCSALTGSEKVMCEAKSSSHKGKLKFF